VISSRSVQSQIALRGCYSAPSKGKFFEVSPSPPFQVPQPFLFEGPGVPLRPPCLCRDNLRNNGSCRRVSFRTFCE